MNENIEVLISESKIAERVKELGKQLSAEYAGKDPIFVCVLKGCMHLLCLISPRDDLLGAVRFHSGGCRTATAPPRRAKCASSRIRRLPSWGGMWSSWRTSWIRAGRSARLSRLLRERGALSVRVCALLDKPSRRVPAG